MKGKNYNFKKGIALFYALIITSIVLAVGLTIFSLIFNGLPLAEIIKNSQKAFFAADAGTECVFYGDIKEKKFSNGETISCFGQPITLSESGGVFVLPSLTLEENQTCIDIKVEKTENPKTTKITSAGHSPCLAGARNRVERTLEVSY